ncbi:MAG: right-handed parallel beta-helix repeat-containing protein [Tahibacter sp.]
MRSPLGLPLGTLPAGKLAVVALLLAVSIGSAPAFAVTTLCVTNAVQLQKALDDVSDGGIFAGTSATIRVVKGNYLTTALSNQAFHYSSTANQAITIAGGYRGACPNPTSSRNPTLSVLDGNATTPVLEIHSAIGPVLVQFLTIQNGKTGGNPAGLSINSHVGDNSGALVENNIIQDNISSGLHGGLFVASGGTTTLLQVANNLIVNNHADNGYGGGAVVGNGGSMGLYGNTIYGNTTSTAGTVGGLSVSSTGTGSVINNIAWSNTGAGLNLATGSMSVSYNDIGTLTGVAPVFGTGNVSVAPKFVSAGTGDFHLAQNSPLLALSPFPEGDYDLDGFELPAHGKVDVGAYEETIFIDGLDGN